MTEQNTKIDGRRKRAADIALAKRTISRASYDALLAGRIGLDEAKAMGRDGAPAIDVSQASVGPGTTTQISRSASAEGGQDGADTPPQPVSRISKDDRTRSCLCGCGRATRGLFARGHDMSMFRVAREHLTEGRELSDEQREYLESSGKMERVTTKLAEENARRRTAEAKKTTRKGTR